MYLVSKTIFSIFFCLKFWTSGLIVGLVIEYSERLVILQKKGETDSDGDYGKLFK